MSQRRFPNDSKPLFDKQTPPSTNNSSHSQPTSVEHSRKLFILIPTDNDVYDVWIKMETSVPLSPVTVGLKDLRGLVALKIKAESVRLGDLCAKRLWVWRGLPKEISAESKHAAGVRSHNTQANLLALMMSPCCTDRTAEDPASWG